MNDNHQSSTRELSTMTTTHTLKTDPEVFAAVLSGAKTFEIRFNDRDFKVGDALRLMETTHTGAEIKDWAMLHYTGREVVKTVSHILTGYGLAEGWCCLSFAPEARLRKFLDAAAGEGFVLDGVDAADLYVALFPAEYRAACAQIDPGVSA